MKKVDAYIKSNMLEAVTVALHGVKGLPGMTVLESKGFGGLPLKDSGSPSDFRLNVKIEIICSDELYKEVVEVIEKSAHTGLRGDGDIIVTSVEEVIRIGTGERS